MRPTTRNRHRFIDPCGFSPNFAVDEASRLTVAPQLRTKRVDPQRLGGCAYVEAVHINYPTKCPLKGLALAAFLSRYRLEASLDASLD